MCGIAGFLDLARRSTDAAALDARLQPMVRCLAHRGPDGHGAWVDAAAGVGLGHRRLAVIDLSPSGAQPMQCATGRFMIVYNGEIYNFAELRQELEQTQAAPNWRGRSDTEILLAAINHWGIEQAVVRLVGMYAFAVWDRREQVLHLVRDRLGEKPLYYGWLGDAFLFGSELKALRAHPSWRGEVDPGAIALLMRHNYIPAPHSIFRGVRKLLPGSIMSVPLAGAVPGRFDAPKRYWSAADVAAGGAAQSYRMDPREAAEELERLLRRSIRQQMVADVPLGAFLSGGVDSSAVVALMQAQTMTPVRTFTIGFREAGYDEAVHARAVAQHLGTQHTELYVTPEEAMAVIPRLPDLYDEPFSDSSQIPTFLVSQLARKAVTVSLSGDGGDELFCGYNRYVWGTQVWQRLGWAPHGVRQFAARGLRAMLQMGGERLASLCAPVLPPRYRYGALSGKIRKAADVLESDGPDALYYRLVSHWLHPELLVSGAVEPPTALTDRESWPRLDGFVERMMYLDLVSYLPDDILVKVDRASMGVSLESRVPFLDHRIVEFAWRLPLDLKLRGVEGKWLLRQVLYRHVPKTLVDRPKMGFGVPLGDWLRGPLREWAQALLDPSRLRREGYFDPVPIARCWQQHLSGIHDHQAQLWNVLMFQAWLEQIGTRPHQV